MKKVSLLFICVLLVSILHAQTTKWGFDGAHSKISFSVTHMMISEVEGQFTTYEGTVLSDEKDFSDAKIDFTIDVSSVNTANTKRDDHLRSADFFDVNKFPKIVFKSTSMKNIGKGEYQLTGDFTMLGVTKPIKLTVKHRGTVNDPWGNTKAGFKIAGTIDRTKWGLKYNSLMDTGGVMIGENIEIICHIELIKQK
ncbi:MAG: YceI family protein [Calditrichia bacterium]|nr:YceI family protein [Calditrichia bacterium]